MTRDSFIAAHKHELAGIVLDAATRSKSGPELSLLFGKAMERIEAVLGRCYDAAHDRPIEAPKPVKELGPIGPLPKAATPPVNGVQPGPLQQPPARRP